MDVEQLEEMLSTPTPAALEGLRGLDSDLVILGVGGKMGPTLARMAARAVAQLGLPYKVYGVARFSQPGVREQLENVGVRTIACDLLDRAALAELPETGNVILMAGQKFGTRELPALTWMVNTVMPALCVERYRSARIVAFSTGNVYPLAPVAGGGSRETDSLGPVGEYAWSCLGRERVLEFGSRTRGTPVAIVRLNYAVELRYGVLVDLALRIAAGDAIDLRMGHVNVLWQGDANAQAIQCLPHAAVPPFVVNVTGPELLSVRAVAQELGRVLGREPVLRGQEQADALVSNTALAQSLFGLPAVSAETVLAWVGEWVRHGGATSGKATRFEEREGTF